MSEAGGTQVLRLHDKDVKTVTREEFNRHIANISHNINELAEQGVHQITAQAAFDEQGNFFWAVAGSIPPKLSPFLAQKIIEQMQRVLTLAQADCRQRN